MNKAIQVLEKVRAETDSVLLFSSITGKDSILLTHYCSQVFKCIVSVYMYTVKDLQYIQKYQTYFEKRYKNIKYLHVPHFSVSWHIHEGLLGIKRNKNIKKIQLSDIIKAVRKQTGIEWVVLGMKQTDGIHRMFELREFEDNAINRMTHRVYPLTDFNNEQVLRLIKSFGLPIPIKYNNDRSQCQEINSKDYIGWLYEKYPEDLKKTIDQYPQCKHLLYEYLESQRVEIKTT